MTLSKVLVIWKKIAKVKVSLDPSALCLTHNIRENPKKSTSKESSSSCALSARIPVCKLIYLNYFKVQYNSKAMFMLYVQVMYSLGNICGLPRHFSPITWLITGMITDTCTPKAIIHSTYVSCEL